MMQYNMNLIIKEQLLNAHILRKQLPSNLIQLINRYVYKEKDHQFIVKKISQIKSRPQQPISWQLLIRDSRNMKISIISRYYGDYHFGSFIAGVLYANLDFVGPYFQEFCIQTLANNPELMHSRHIIQFQQSPTYTILASYLINGQIFRIPYKRSKKFQFHAYNILKFILSNKYIQGVDNVFKLFYGLALDLRVGDWTVQTVLMILTYPLAILENDNVEREYPHIDAYNAYNKYLKTQKRPNLYNFFDGLFKQFIQKQPYRPEQQLKRYLYPTPQQYQIQRRKAKLYMQQIIKTLDRKHPHIVHILSDLIMNGIMKTKNLKLISYLIQLSSFRDVMMSPQFIFKVFACRYTKWAQILWNWGQNKNIISKMTIRNMNVLEISCNSYGLSHNIISMLWNSGLFTTMPQIKNKKSQRIIKYKYKL